MDKKVKIHITDDHKIVTDGIASYLMCNDDFTLCGSSSSAKELLGKVKTEQPDILLLDIKLPGLSGLQIAKILQNDYPEIKIIILSSITDKETIEECVQSGCKGFLPKSVTEEEFFEALKIVNSGDLFFARSLQSTVFKSYSQSLISKKKEAEILSEREVEVIKLFADGYSYSEIGEQLFISKRTVETHKKNILAKLGLKSTVDLVKYAILNGLVSI